MLWECSECGDHIRKKRRPAACPGCGRAGVFFVEAERGIEGDENAETLAASWLERGMRWSPKTQRTIAEAVS